MSAPKIAVVDYGLGNVKSITNGFRKLGVESILTRDPSIINGASACVLPGVGAFAYGMKMLSQYKLDTTLKSFADSGKPLLGICLGMQLLFDESDEFSVTQGLGLIPGRVEYLGNFRSESMLLPHVCWNEIQEPQEGRWENTMLHNAPASACTYFVHSYATRPENPEHILATTKYEGIEFCSAIQHANITGVQFHPEKSGPLGLSILKQFVENSSGEQP